MVFLKPQNPKKFPSKKMTENLVITEETVLEDMNNPLKKDAQFQLAVQQQQINKMADVIQEIAERLVGLEAKVIELEGLMRFPDGENPLDKYPEVSGRLNVGA
jgi:hypothetical protein